MAVQTDMCVCVYGASQATEDAWAEYSSKPPDGLPLAKQKDAMSTFKASGSEAKKKQKPSRFCLLSLLSLSLPMCRTAGGSTQSGKSFS